MNRRNVLIASIYLLSLISIAGSLYAGEINKQALDELIAKARETNSSALVVMHDGEVIVDETFGNERYPIQAMSVTKMVASLAIASLIHEGKLKSIDQFVHEFYPEWNEGQKAKVTIRHLMQHTSGLKANPTTEEIYASDNFVQLALDTELISEPGEKWFYNNRAINIIAGIVEKASGQRMDKYFEEKIFQPLKIKEYSWQLDAAGNPHVFAGLVIYPTDLAKIGQLILNNGIWSDERIFPEYWFEPKFQLYGRSELGLLSFYNIDRNYQIKSEFIEEWRQASIDSEKIEQVKPLTDRWMKWSDLQPLLVKQLGENWQDFRDNELYTNKLQLFDVEPDGELISISHSGWLGQKLIVYPGRELVVVRMIIYSEKAQEDGNSFPDIDVLAEKLINR